MTITVTVTAPEGQRLKVRLQNKGATISDNAGKLDDAGNPLPVTPVPHWADAQTDTIASESRAYQLSATQRVIVEGA
jgi:hypothetical protein